MVGSGGGGWDQRCLTPHVQFQQYTGRPSPILVGCSCSVDTSVDNGGSSGSLQIGKSGLVKDQRCENSPLRKVTLDTVPDGETGGGGATI